MMSGFSATTVEFTDLNSRMGQKTPPREAVPDLVRKTTKLTDLSCAKELESVKEMFPPNVEQEVKFTSSTNETTQNPHNDFHSDSDSEFPELPSFKNIPFSPRTPQKQLKYSHTRQIAHFLPTPNTTPARRLKRLASPLDSPSRARSFKKDAPKASPRPSFASRTPPSSIIHEIKHKPANPISSLEFDRMAEAILLQVDWKAVSEHVASNRPEGVFRRVIVSLLKEKAGMLKKSEKEQSASTVDLEK